ncbi:MAG TPA: tetratricopeptide repeat protein [Myxococcota bacterium]|nr:tetratricopeptide repeat protein [Myxococcota bacterium]
MSGHLLLVASVRLNGAPIGEVRAAPPRPVTLGPSLSAAVPAFGAVRWQGWERAVIEDADGGVHELSEGESVSLGLGELEVDLRLVRPVALRRAAPWRWMASLSWFFVVFAVNLNACSGVAFTRAAQCTWLGDALHIPCPEHRSRSGGRNAELLARILRKDFDGDSDDAFILQQTPRHVSRIEVDNYLPAGDVGPITEMGGAERVTVRPERREKAEAALPPARKKVDAPPPAPEAPPDGAVLLQPDAAEAEGEADTEGVAPDGDEPVDDPSRGRSEEKRGWGVRAWLDASPPEDKREVELSKRLVERKLRIDPDDPAALGLLAYYQYLQEDYPSAERSFDRLIEMYPDESAGYNNKALVFKRRGEYAKEEGLYRVALAIEPDEPTALSNLAVNMAHQKRYPEALALMDKVDKLTPEDPYCALHRAKIHAAMGHDEQALSYLRVALEGMASLDVMHHVEFRQDIRLDPVFTTLRHDPRFIAVLEEYYGGDSPVGGGR